MFDEYVTSAKVKFTPKGKTSRRITAFKPFSEVTGAMAAVPGPVRVQDFLRERQKGFTTCT
jgi:hypothetical protein